MSFKTLTLSAAIAVGLLAAPAAHAQRSEGRTVRGPTTRTQPAISGGARTQVEHRRHGDRNRHRYYPRYHRHYSPFYGYPFSDRYPHGFPGYGYPYFGASAALYYYGYHPQPRARVYTPRAGESVVAEVQRALARNGYYRGAVDGVIGNGTRNAIRAYERANGLRVDGRIDGELLRSMRIG